MKSRFALFAIAVTALSLIPNNLFAAQTHHSKKQHRTTSKSHHAPGHRSAPTATKVSTAKAFNKPTSVRPPSAPASAPSANIDAGDGNPATLQQTLDWIESKLASYGGGAGTDSSAGIFAVTRYANMSYQGTSMSITAYWQYTADIDGLGHNKGDVVCAGHDVLSWNFADINPGGVYRVSYLQAFEFDCAAGEQKIHVDRVIDQPADPNDHWYSALSDTNKSSDNVAGFVYVSNSEIQDRLITAFAHAARLAQKLAPRPNEPF